MKNTIVIFFFCLSLFALNAGGQVKNDSIKIMRRIPLGYRSRTDTGGRVTTVTTYQYPPFRVTRVGFDAYSLWVSIITGCEGCIYATVHDVEFNTTDKTIYNRDDFKRFGILRFPNIWH